MTRYNAMRQRPWGRQFLLREWGRERPLWLVRMKTRKWAFPKALAAEVREATSNALEAVAAALQRMSPAPMPDAGPSDEARLRAEGMYCDTLPGTATDQPTSRTAAEPLVPSPSKKYGL